jgi:hypothetical protein
MDFTQNEEFLNLYYLIVKASLVINNSWTAIGKVHLECFLFVFYMVLLLNIFKLFTC